MNSRKYLPPMSMLIAFESCSRLHKFTAAANELSLTQSAVSRQIRALEEIVGAELFVRERQAVRLTPVGEVYADEVRQALNSIYNSTLRIRANPGSGMLTVAILPTMGSRWLAPLLPGFVQQNPGVTLNLVTRLAPINLDADGVHAAIHFGPPEYPRANIDFLFDEMVFPACSKALKEQYGFTCARDLLKAPLLHLASRPHAWEQWFESQGVEKAEVSGITIDQFATATQAASAGLGVALLPEFLFQKELERGELVAAIDVRSRSQGKYYLACSSTKTWYPPLAAFRKWIKEQATNSFGNIPESFDPSSNNKNT